MGGGPDNEEEFVILNKVSAAELEEIDKSKAANTENAFEEAKQRKNLHFSDGISKKSEAGCAIDEKKKKGRR